MPSKNKSKTFRPYRKKIPCNKCEKPFISGAEANRICSKCNRDNTRLIPGIRHYRVRRIEGESVYSLTN